MSKRRGRPLAVAILGAGLALQSATPSFGQLGLGLPGDSGVNRNSSRQENPASDEVEEFARELREPDPVRRLEAVKQLATQKDEKAVELMIEATSDQDLRVRLKAIECLGNAKASAAIPVLIQSLYLSETEPWLKQKVLVALGKIGDSRAAQPISDFLSRDVDVPTLGTAIYALGEIGDESTLDDLEAVAKQNDEPTLQRVARDAIAKINQRQINPQVEVRALRNDDEDIRPATASAAPPLAY